MTTLSAASNEAIGSNLKEIYNEFNVFGAGWEKITQPFYDYQSYPALGQTSFTFFQNPIGQAGKTVHDTNMRTGGQFSRGQMFVVEGFEVDVQLPNAASTDTGLAKNWNELTAIYKAGAFKFSIGTKDYAQIAPLMQLPPSFRMAGAAAVGSLATQVDYVAAAGNAFKVIPFMIPENTQFECQVTFKTALPVSVETRIGVVMNGVWIRRKQ